LQTVAVRALVIDTYAIFTAASSIVRGIIIVRGDGIVYFLRLMATVNICQVVNSITNCAFDMNYFFRLPNSFNFNSTSSSGIFVPVRIFTSALRNISNALSISSFFKP
jgi:hypothetical protein